MDVNQSGESLFVPPSTVGTSNTSVFLTDTDAVTVHALLPMQLWKWKKGSEVYICYGNERLGSWQCDCGPMKPVRYTVDYYN